MKSFALLRSLMCMVLLIALPLSVSINAQNISGIKMQRPSSTPAKSTTSKSTSKKTSTSESRPKAKTSSEDREKHAEKSRPKASASSSSNKKSTPKLRVRKVSTPDDDDAERTVRSNVKAARSNNKEESPEAKRLNELNQQYNEASQAVAECDKKMRALRIRYGRDYEQPTAVPMLTEAYNLPAKKVVHIVGPIVQDALGKN